jgi:UDP:flavonoid glycosyltransferase YjiC (YdhE family)
MRRLLSNEGRAEGSELLRSASEYVMACYDILMVSDLRLPGGTTTSMAEEIRAQASAGYRTVLLHVNSTVSRGLRGINANLRSLIDAGIADLALPGDEVRARHAVVRDPRVAQCIGGPLRPVTVDGVSLVASRPPRDVTGASEYDPITVSEVLRRCLGHPPTWQPTDLAVRWTLEGQPGITLGDRDWVDIIDAERWEVDRSAGVRDVPVIGRHGRPDPDKWPIDPGELLAAYPEADDVAVRILGGARPAERVLGRIPERWVVEPFDARDPRDFLSVVDFFVYYHNPKLQRMSGRAVLEALASGAVAVLPANFQVALGDAAVYTTPGGVRTVVAQLATDRDAYLAQSNRGRSYVRSRHGHDVHLARIGALIGPPRKPMLQHSAQVRLTATERKRTRVLFVTSNGTGMGHLTRLLAMATRSSDAVEPFFFSLSSAVPVVARYGYGWEYFPSRDDLDVYAKEWHPLFTERLADIIERFRPQALVFDGVIPYDGLGIARQRYPDLRFVWSRRPMWQEGKGVDFLERSAWFDMVIEPGEFAAAADRGPTVGRNDAIRVPPITLLDAEEILDREEARASLAIETDAKAVLVTLGAGNFNDLTSDLDVVADAFGRRPGWTVFATQAPIARAGLPAGRDIKTISVYPLARYLAAFDIAIVACGYNAYHESIMAAVPTIFVPKAKVVDDQHARAYYAAQVGVGAAVEEVNPESIGKAIDRMLDRGEVDQMRKRCIELAPENGAEQAMNLIEDLLARQGVLR